MSAVENLSEEQRTELRESFDEFDLDGNGHITTKELGECLKKSGIQLPGYKLREIVEQIDTDKNMTIEFDEFVVMFANLKAKDIANSFQKAISKKEGIVNKSSTVAESAGIGIKHSYATEEKVAFVDFLNSKLAEDPDLEKLLPIESDGDQLFSKMEDGLILCKLINYSAPDTIDERAINKTKLKVFTKHENLTLAINSALAIGCNVVNIGAEDFSKGTPHLVLGLLWQIIRIGLFSKIDIHEVPGLYRLLHEGEDPEVLKRLSPEELLIRWVNYQMEQAGEPRRIANFSGDIKDSEVYIALLSQICPNDLKGDLQHVTLGPNHTKRAEGMLENADVMDCRAFVSANDVVKGNSKLNTAFVANLFNHFPCLEPPDEDFVEVEETREEKTYRNWMNSLGVKPRVNFIYSDLCDGLVILQLFDIANPGIVEWNRVTRGEKLQKLGGNMKRIENCNYCVELAGQMKMSTVGIAGSDINAGNEKLTLAVVWQLMRAYTLSILQKISRDLGEENPAPVTDERVVAWANEKLQAGGKDSTFRSFQDGTLSSGRTVLDLVDCIQPNSVNYDNYIAGKSFEEKLDNAKYAITMARKIGAPIYALPEDIVEVKPKMVMTVFACLMACDKAKEAAATRTESAQADE